MGCKVDYENIDLGLANIIFELIENDDLFKMLKYNTKDALSQPITQQDKLVLINQSDESNSRIKMVPYNSDIVIDNAQTQIRISLLNGIAVSKGIADIVVMIQIITHNSLWLLDGMKQRPLRLYTAIMQELNETNVKNLGRLSAIGRDMRLTYFNDQFIGYTINFEVSRG